MHTHAEKRNGEGMVRHWKYCIPNKYVGYGKYGKLTIDTGLQIFWLFLSLVVVVVSPHISGTIAFTYFIDTIPIHSRIESDSYFTH